MAHCCFTFMQLKDMAEKLPPGVYDGNGIRSMNIPNGLDHPQAKYNSNTAVEPAARINTAGGDPDLISSPIEGFSGTERVGLVSNETNLQLHTQRSSNSIGRDDHANLGHPNGSGWSGSPNKPASPLASENGSKSRSLGNTVTNQVEAEWIEQYEPGVYITLVALWDGTRDLKRVRFRYLIVTPTDLSFVMLSVQVVDFDAFYILMFFILACVRIKNMEIRPSILEHVS